jgi:hypothetical protein
MRTHTVTTYHYDELSDDAKEKARGWYLQNGLEYEWWDHTYDTAKDAGRILGIDMDAIFFSGFWSQGDGACFTGSYKYKAGWRKALRAEFGGDVLASLERIGQELQDVQQPFLYQLEATVTHQGHYLHSGCAYVDVVNAQTGDSALDVPADAIQDALRGFMDLIYRWLENEYQYRTSEEVIAETIRANEYEFTEAGSIY